MELQPDRIVAEGAAGQPGPAQRVLALTDPLLSGAAAVVERAHSFRRPLQVGDDEPDPWVQFTLMPLDLRNNAARPGPTLRLVAEVGEEDLWLIRRPADGPGQQVPDPLLQHRVGRQADSVADLLRFQQLVQLGPGERRVAAEVEGASTLAVAGDHG